MANLMDLFDLLKVEVTELKASTKKLSSESTSRKSTLAVEFPSLVAGSHTHLTNNVTSALSTASSSSGLANFC